jgi:hypothetical protein
MKWTVSIRYNYGIPDDGRDFKLHHERHPCPAADSCTEMAAQRIPDAMTTVYEIVFPAHSLGQEMLTSGFSFGLSIVVNEGDMNGAAGDGTVISGQAGQKGWDGWAPYAIVVGGKRAENAGLATLVGTFVGRGLAGWSPSGSAGQYPASCAGTGPAAASCAVNGAGDGCDGDVAAVAADGDVAAVDATTCAFTPAPQDCIGDGCLAHPYADLEKTEVDDMVRALRGGQAPLAFYYVNRFSTALLYGRAGCFTG